MTQLTTLLLAAALVMPAPALAQDASTAWRTVAMAIDPGREVHVRLVSGQRFTATLVEARETGVMLQPKTRVPVPVQEVRYAEIVSLEQRNGGNTGKVVAIAVAAGAGVFLAIIGILAAAYSD
jgi:hypothetical protein